MNYYLTRTILLAMSADHISGGAKQDLQRSMAAARRRHYQAN